MNRQLSRRTVLLAGALTTAGLTAACNLLSTDPAESGSRSGGTAVGGRGKESPMLAQKVKAGELPPMKERLPTKPFVLEPVDRTGTYGGTLRKADSQQGSTAAIAQGRANLLEWALGRVEVGPGLAESWEISPDGLVYTFHLRDGLRWSDGEPCTTDDIVFAVDKVIKNTTLMPAFPTWLSPGGKPVEVEQVDELTVRFKLGAPQSLMLSYIASPNGDWLVLPKHYLSKFHPEFMPQNEVDAAAKEAGYESWDQYFVERNDIQANPDRPVLGPWVLTTPATSSNNRAVFERNPYFWKVDPDGRQLPYIDRVTIEVFEAETVVLRTSNGDFDFQARGLSAEDTPVLAKTAEQNGYEILRWQGTGPYCIHPNQSAPDPVMRALMQDLRFRQALSYAIDRDEVNKVIFGGQGIISQPCAMKDDPYFVDGMGQRYLEFRPEESEKLLDEVGLSKVDSDGMRLRPDGRPLRLDLWCFEFQDSPRPFELVTEYWREVGINARVQTVAQELWLEKVTGNQVDISAYSTNLIEWELSPVFYVPSADTTYWAPAFGKWYLTRGAEGEEPPPKIRELQVLWDELQAAVDEEARIERGQQILWSHDENLWMIEVARTPFTPVVRKNNLINVPKVLTADYQLGNENFSRQDQFFFAG